MATELSKTPPPADQHWSAQNAAALDADAGALAMLLMRHVLRDGEVVILLLKPSLWWIVLTCMRFAAVVLILMLLAARLDHLLPGRTPVYVEVGVFIISGRLMWAVCQWMGKLYVLTDQRLLALSGIFSVRVYDCPLRQIAEVRGVSGFREKALRLGTILIFPRQDSCLLGQWQTVRRPQWVLEQILSAMARIRRNDNPGS